MTAKQILDAFSESLMQDERILTPRERELLANLLQNSKSICTNNPEIESAVNTAIARSVGETVAQRAFSLLGGSIVEKILARSGISSRTADAQHNLASELMAPQPPTPGPRAPQPPTPSPLAPQPPTPGTGPDSAPQPPTPGAARAKAIGIQQTLEHISFKSMSSQPSTAAATLPQCVVLDEFLAPQELDELMSFVLEREAEFRTSEVISPNRKPGVVDYDHRRSRVLMNAGRHHEVLLDRIRGVLPSVLEELGMETFPVTRAEVQITASNDGDFFRAHSDDANESIASRNLTFVYFFHHEPRQFEGGELRLYDLPWSAEERLGGNGYQAISPRQNQIVFFPSSMLHEITPVACATRAFADSRFTLNGWLHK